MKPSLFSNPSNENAKEVGVYLFTNVETLETYIGSTKNLQFRFKKHINSLEHNKHTNKKFQEAYNKNPNFEYSEIRLDDRDIAFDVEQSLINEFIGNPLLLNMSFDVRNGGVLEHTQESKNKMGIKSKERWTDPIFRDKVLQGHINRNKTLSEETKDKISLANKGIPKSQEHADINRQNLVKIHEEKQKPVSINGIIFTSKKDAFTNLGINHSTLNERIKSTKEKWNNWKELSKV